MYSFRKHFRAWPLAICAVVVAVGCHSDEIAGTKSRPDGPALAVAPTVGFVWGVVGHPGVQAAYEGAGPQLTEQLNYLNTLRARYYRIDLRTDNAGNVTLPTTFGGILNAADARGIKILPVLVRTPEKDSSLAWNYAIGDTIGFNFAVRYRSKFAQIEAGNELDNYAIEGNPDGKLIGHYNSARLRAATSMLRGMTIGIHRGSPGTGVIIDAGFTHWGFMQALKRDSVPFDVYGWHWYSDMDNGSTFGAQVPANLPDPNKEIWITEVNRRNTTTSPNHPANQAAVLRGYVKHFYSIPRVKAFFVYELFEEPAHRAGNPTESFYGLVGCANGDVGCAGTRTLKPGFDAYRYGIEEQLFGYEDFVYHLYLKVNRRQPDQGGLTFWTNRYKAAPNDKLGLINAFIPEESYKLFIKDQFQVLLDRTLTTSPSDAAGLAYWNDRMRNGSTRHQVIVDFCVTPEFWSKSGSTNAGFVDRLYLKLWKKSSSTDPNRRQSFINQLNSGRAKWDVAGDFLVDTAYRSLFVKEQILMLLNRASPSTSEVNTYLSQMANGASQETIIRTLLLLAEFNDAAMKAGYDRRT